jgi:hypothetical protein
VSVVIFDYLYVYIIQAIGPPHQNKCLKNGKIYLNTCNKMLSLVFYRVIKAASIAEKIHNSGL